MTGLARAVMLVTGMSGAGKSTALRTLEDIGWEVVDNLPLSLIDRLLAAPAPHGGDNDRPLAIGIDSRTRGFDPAGIVGRLRPYDGLTLLFLDCAGAELQRRYSETRRRHPLAPDRPAEDGIARERELLDPLRRAADQLIDTTDVNVNALQQEIRARFATSDASTTLSIMSFGFARGVPRDADLVFDMRFLRNPHWEAALKPLSGLDPDVAAYVAADPAFDEAIARIDGLLALLLPRYSAEGKSYVTVALGCTGGKHRSVHCAETIARNLRDRGFSPTILHRDLVSHAGTATQRSTDAGTETRTSGG